MVSPTHTAQYDTMTVDEWESAAKPLRDEASASANRLFELVDKHEADLIKAWKGEHITAAGDGSAPLNAKKQREALNARAKYRKDLLLQHWPDMSLSHREDLRLFADRKPTDKLLPEHGSSEDRSSTPEMVSVRKKRAALLWPHMNVDELSTRWWHLIQLFQSRARNPLWYFSHEDMPLGRLEFLGLFLRLKNVPGCLMSLLEDDTWGKCCDVWPNAGFAMLIKRRGLPMGPGLLLLEIQAKLYTSLADIATTLVGISISIEEEGQKGLAGASVLTETEDGGALAGPSGLTSRLISSAPPDLQEIWHADERDEAPYIGSKAGQAIIDYQIYLTMAGFNGALHHWCLLRSDPGYLKDEVTRWREHELNILLDTNNSQVAAALSWTEAVKSCVTTALQKVRYWKLLHDRTFGMIRGTQFPELFDTERCSLYSFLSQWEGPALLHLRKLWTFSPDLRTYSRRIADAPSKTASSASASSDKAGLSPAVGKVEPWKCERKTEYATGGNKKNKKGTEKKRKEWVAFEWWFHCLFDRKVRHVLGTQTILDELDRLLTSGDEAMRNPPREQGMLSDLVCSQLAEVAAHAQLFEDHFVSERAVKYEMLDLGRKYHDAVTAMGTLEEEVWRKAFAFEGSEELWKMGSPANGDLEYPVDKPKKSFADRQQLDHADAYLAAFWKRFDMESEAQDLSHVIEGLDLLQRTLSPREYIQKAGYATQHNPFPFGGTLRNNMIRLNVDRKALDVWHTMLDPASKKAGSLEPVDWDDLVHALKECDFKLSCRYSREWLVVPPQIPGDSVAVLIQQPAPGKKVPVAALRRYGYMFSGLLGLRFRFFKENKVWRADAEPNFPLVTRYNVLKDSRTETGLSRSSRGGRGEDWMFAQ